ncbi:carbohydrate esterase family 16 protein [Whalleya microplaca]|nr:carbohydrate esterase family 16 protein [Whalleya microplaca]
MRTLTLLLTSIAASTAIPTNIEVENLVVFGDSYSDEGRLAYFQSHNGTAPPAGVVIPTANITASGGNTWPHFVSQQLGSTTYNYAVSGATCSNEIIRRYLSSINGPFPSVIDYEIPAFLADVEFAESATGGTTFFANREPNNTIYTLWIGTNDLAPRTTISDFTDCIWTVFDGIYSTGGRHFVLFNEAPLNKSPLYAATENSGVGDNNYWANKTAYNTTEIEQKMLEYTTSVNTIFSYGAPFQLLVEARWPGASFTIFDIHQLISDINNDPSKYLDSPANSTGAYYECPIVASGDTDCKTSEYPLSSFLWYDELHPSFKTGKPLPSSI